MPEHEVLQIGHYESINKRIDRKEGKAWKSAMSFLGEARFPDNKVRCHAWRRLRDLLLRDVVGEGR